MLGLDVLQHDQEIRNVFLNDAPYGVVIHAQISVYQSIASGDDQPPWNLGVASANVVRNARCGLPNHGQISKSGIVCKIT